MFRIIRISYSIVPVEPYEKILNVDPEDYTTFIDNPQKVIFFADVDGSPVGQIKMVPWWNKFAYVEELTVDTEFRGKGLGRALLTCAIEWAKARDFPASPWKPRITTCRPVCSMKNVGLC